MNRQASTLSIITQLNVFFSRETSSSGTGKMRSRFCSSYGIKETGGRMNKKTQADDLAVRGPVCRRSGHHVRNGTMERRTKWRKKHA
ncbi:hypothetical protein XI25_17455 [Paenibacillus sp. DMB20]|nr:hypothetical protein XI25_17455 [Paenibacillus sp. DMB20]